MQKNEEYIGEVSAIGNNGEGIVKMDGFVVFVPFSLIGEKIKFKILKVNSKIAFGKLLSVLVPSKIRREPLCPFFKKCGGCHLQHINYLDQLHLKENTISLAFNKVAFINPDILPTVSGDNEFRYRNKLQLPVVEDNGKKAVIGFYAENSHRVVEIDDCLINGLYTKTIISVFNKYFSEQNIKGYKEGTSDDRVREIAVKEIDNCLIITVVVTKNGVLKNIPILITLLKDKLKCEFSLFQNINSAKTNVIYGDEFSLLYGKENYSSIMLGVKYQIGVQSFMQVNSNVCKKLYSFVNENIKSNDKAVVIDAYSGAGLMTAVISKNVYHAYGIEIVPEAVKLANILAKDNGLDNRITNFCGKCEDILPKLVMHKEFYDKKINLVLDPPRKGCDSNVIKAILSCNNIDKIIYVSCLPSSLARDVGLLIGTLSFTENGIEKSSNPSGNYSIESITPFDMFANTKHVETVCVLKREK